MYNQITSNKRRTVLLFIVIITLYALVGWALAQVYGNQLFFVLAIVISLIQAVVSYYYADKIALFATGAKGPLKKSDAPEVYRAVENLSITAGVPMPMSISFRHRRLMPLPPAATQSTRVLPLPPDWPRGWTKRSLGA